MSLVKRVAAVVLAATTVGAVATAAPAQAGIVQFWEQFESTNHGSWWTGGGAGFDYQKGLAHKGVGNAWIRATSGWNSINTTVGVYPNADCVASAWIRLSDHLDPGYMSVRSWNGKDAGPVINEIKLVGPGPVNEANSNYNQYVFHFNPGNAQNVLFYVGMWGNGKDAWAQIDDVVIQCPTPH